jgi:hypothetical protein
MEAWRTCFEGGRKDEGNNNRMDNRWKSNTTERKEINMYKGI